MIYNGLWTWCADGPSYFADRCRRVGRYLPLVDVWVAPLSSLLAAIIGGVVVHLATRRREVEKDRRAERIKYLTGSFRIIVRYLDKTDDDARERLMLRWRTPRSSAPSSRYATLGGSGTSATSESQSTTGHC